MPEILNIQTAIHRIGGIFIDVNLCELKIDGELTVEDARKLGEALRKNNSLQSLDLSGCLIDDLKIQYIISQANESLTDVNLSNNNITRYGVAELIAKTSLKKINLANNKVRDTGVKTFSLSKGSQNLEWLDLASNEITDESDKFLMDLIKKNICLRELILDGNKIPEDTIRKIQSIIEERSGKPSTLVGAGSAQKLSDREADIAIGLS